MGNLLDLIQPYGQSDYNPSKKEKLLSMLRYYFLVNPFKLNVLKLSPLVKLAKKRGMLSPLKGDAPIYINNRELDNFIDRFKSAGCRNVSCDVCNHCSDYANKAIKIIPRISKRVP